MFKIGNAKRLPDPTVALIRGSYQDLLYYDQPILYFGTNITESPVLGSFVTEDPKSGTTRYLHSVMTWGFYEEYLARKLSYRDILKKCKLKYFVDFVNGSDPTAYAIRFDDIPERFRPTQDSFCPLVSAEVTDGYELHLTGGLADRHRVKSRDQNEVNTASKKLFLTPLEDMFALEPELYAEPTAGGSFTLNLEVNLGLLEQSLFIEEKHYRDFLGQYLTYCFNDLYGDLRRASSRQDLNSPAFDSLLAAYSHIASVVRMPMEGLRTKLTETLLKTIFHIRDLAALTGESFHSISLAPRGSKGMAVMGVVSPESTAMLDQAFTEAERLQADRTEIDKIAREYHILIYSLNVDSRSGRAYHRPHFGTQWEKPRFHIRESLPLEGSIYTGSLYKGEEIAVKAIGHRLDGRLVKLDVLF